MSTIGSKPGYQSVSKSGSIPRLNFSVRGRFLTRYVTSFLLALSVVQSLAVFLSSPLVVAQSSQIASEATSQNSDTQPIKLGMSTVLSGPSQYLGQAMSRGISQLFERINASGGIDGRRLQLYVMDDAYIPDIAAANTEHLINSEGVLAIIGNVGTPTAEQVMPIVRDNGVVFFGAFTGSNSLRAVRENDVVFNYRASYEQEMAVIVNHIMESNISPRRIALLLQANESGELDGFGRAGLSAATSALEAIGFGYTENLIQAKYVVNSLETQQAIIETLDADYSPEAFILVGSYQPSSHFIQYMQGIFPQANFYNLSFAGAGALADSLHSAQLQSARRFSDRIYMTQVVPPADVDLPDLPRDLVEREAHFTAQFFVSALGNIDGEIDRESIREVMMTMFTQAESGNSSQQSSVSSTSNQASDYVVLTRFQNGFWVGNQD